MRPDDDSGYRELGALIAKARRKAGLSQEHLAEKLGRSQGYVSKMELGRRKLDVLEFLEVAGAVGLDPADVIRRLKSGGRR